MIEIFISALCVAIMNIFIHSMLITHAGDFLSRYLPDYNAITDFIARPLYRCYICMSSVWGLGFYAAICHENFLRLDWIVGVLFILCLAGIATIFRILLTSFFDELEINT